MKILVTGANGMLGKDLCPLLEKHGHEVIKTDIEDLNIRNKPMVMDFVKANKPDLIIHGAAYTAVDKAEEEKELAYEVNYHGTKNLAKAAKEVDAKIVYISTDYVFDGTKETPYTPKDKPNPKNIYGFTKLEGELAVQDETPKHYIVRTSWLYGKNGKNFVETMITLAQKNPKLKVVADQFGCPTYTIALAEGIIKLIEDNAKFGTYHICGGGQTNWCDFAKKILEFAGINTPVEPINTTGFPQLAIRPKYAVMDNEGRCPSWEDSLKQYIERR
ncbi:MAG: dTDP-4-dehydrorhamnose reductase [Elusimicrobiaceae bacterium]|jgi:dTDP-4-dehydrorhamnose reductase|nr:dTDP-4-dehydrorhamnose reductase [Elusimicrobiaceae bacterium]MBT3954953.1 dTDP-4-dehydrorhamnose reductase [Elusimicrobiaceae bacterium]MBT4008603.1 dTDP-4-dehydrorhamnose reductase [Elusimicrobiaceae bacterium]MBT4402959.1 dTDP-4-dehydrorhamnose reductase [Elusimicrobiaceae bacterium]MBT4439769.1 dTDP-4-dehydrorhamnose reductase [Elusimicrobiaceae bacterium]